MGRGGEGGAAELRSPRRAPPRAATSTSSRRVPSPKKGCPSGQRGTGATTRSSSGGRDLRVWARPRQGREGGGARGAARAWRRGRRAGARCSRIPSLDSRSRAPGAQCARRPVPDIERTNPRNRARRALGPGRGEGSRSQQRPGRAGRDPPPESLPMGRASASFPGPHGENGNAAAGPERLGRRAARQQRFGRSGPQDVSRPGNGRDRRQSGDARKERLARTALPGVSARSRLPTIAGQVCESASEGPGAPGPRGGARPEAGGGRSRRPVPR
jgi:hypothetical protein